MPEQVITCLYCGLPITRAEKIKDWYHVATLSNRCSITFAEPNIQDLPN